MIFVNCQKYSEDSIIEFVCFSIHVGLLFITENNANFDPNFSSKRAKCNEVQFF